MNQSPKSPFRAIVEPRDINFAGFPVRRLLPRIGVRSVGPWVFLDHMGPHRFDPGHGMDVPAHPHINLATVTYLFEGRITHRDSLGTRQDIEPGAINLMVAGRGIAHSERTPPDLRTQGSTTHGIQLWSALPDHAEELTPSFHHYPADAIPRTRIGGVDLRVMMGSAFGVESPVEVLSPSLYVEARMKAEQNLPVPETTELAIYPVSGSLSVDGEVIPASALAVLEPGRHEIRAVQDSLCIILGGEPLGKRYMWWNFVSSRKERILQAMDDWKFDRFGPIEGDNEDRTPLPPTDSYSFMKD